MQVGPTRWPGVVLGVRRMSRVPVPFSLKGRGMITLTIGDADAEILLELLDRRQGAADVTHAISAAEPGEGMYLMSLTPANARWFRDQLVSVQRSLLARAKRSGKQRQTLRTLNRLVFMLASRLEGTRPDD